MGCFDKPSTKTQSMSTLSGPQNSSLNQLLGLAGETLGQADPFRFMGNRVADLGGLTQDALQFLGGIPGQLGGAAQQGFGSIANLLGGQVLDPIFQRGQDMFGRSLEMIGNKFGGMNATSSSSARDAMTRALEQFTTASQAQAIPAALQSQQLGLSGIGQLLGGLGQGTQQLLQGGGVQQGQQQNLINEQMTKQAELNPLANPAFQISSQLAGFPTTENLVKQQGPGLGYTGTAGLMSGIGQSLGLGIG